MIPFIAEHKEKKVVVTQQYVNPDSEPCFVYLDKEGNFSNDYIDRFKYLEPFVGTDMNLFINK